MEATDINNCLYTRYVNLDTNYIRLFFKLTETTDVGLIHDIRVSIKKIRTFYKMMDRMFTGFSYEKNYKPFKRIFLSAGVLRTNHIYQENLELAEMNMNISFDLHKESLKFEEQKILKDFRNLIEKADIYDFLKGRRKIRRMLGQQFDFQDITGYIGLLVNEILFLSDNHIMNPHYIHEMRKIFKELDYITSWMNKCRAEPVMDPALYEKIHDFQDTMGLWHDVYDSLMYFQSLNLSGRKEFRTESFGQLIHHLIKSESEKYNNLVVELGKIKKCLDVFRQQS